MEVVIPEWQRQHHGFEQPAGLEVGHPPSQQQPIYELPPANSNTEGVDPSGGPSPGLEVAHPKSTQQQIYEFPTSDVPGADQHEKASGLGKEPFFKKEQICGLRRRKFWLALTIVLLVIIAVIVGTVLGTRKHDSSSASSSGTATATVTIISPDLPTSTSSSTPTSIRANSRLAVTGWRTGQEYSIRLFYQGPDDYLRYSAYESTSGEWAAPVMSVKATARSPIGATAFNHSIYGGDDVLLSPYQYLPKPTTNLPMYDSRTCKPSSTTLTPQITSASKTSTPAPPKMDLCRKRTTKPPLHQDYQHIGRVLFTRMIVGSFMKLHMLGLLQRISGMLRRSASQTKGDRNQGWRSCPQH